jgi:hypothetical protein
MLSLTSRLRSALEAPPVAIEQFADFADMLTVSWISSGLYNVGLVFTKSRRVFHVTSGHTAEQSSMTRPAGRTGDFVEIHNQAPLIFETVPCLQHEHTEFRQLQQYLCQVHPNQCRVTGCSLCAKSLHLRTSILCSYHSLYGSKGLYHCLGTAMLIEMRDLRIDSRTTQDR